MMKLIIFLLVILEVIFTVECEEPYSCSRSCNSKESKVEDFQYFVLVQQDPGGFCYLHNCSISNIPKTWTLHGLWPSNDNSHSTYECCGPPTDDFNMSRVEDLKTELNSAWPNLKGSDDIFWGHEWCCHGRCAKPQLQTEHEYFAQVLTLYNKYNFGTILHNGNIYPNELGYNRSEILNAFDYVIPGAKGMLKLECCKKSRKAKQILWQIKLCLDHAFSPIKCGNNESDTCDTNELIYYYKRQEEHI